jgi:predicted NAD/FAD-binding protein
MTVDSSPSPRVAVVGSGVAGLTAAYLLRTRYDVTLFEADGRLGGHAHTHRVPTPEGRVARIDSGFIVHNENTYPNLVRLFAELGVSTQDSEMSMSVRCQGCGLEYAGGRGAGGLFAAPGNLARPAFLQMLGEVPRFHRAARRLLAQPETDDATDGGPSLGAFLESGGYSRYFVDHFMMPLVSAVWSAGPQVSAQYPARYLFEFLRNHGMLTVAGSPTWKTVVGGSHTYVQRVADQLATVRVSTPVRAVVRHSDQVEVRDHADRSHQMDAVVIATHADQALALLADATVEEKEVLGAFEYSRNTAWLHTDASILPRRSRARASWNYLKRSCSHESGPPLLSYHMNRLMRLAEPTEYLVTLNGSAMIDETTVVEKMDYEHPIYTASSLAAQRRLPDLSTDRIAFAGAYHGWGFHEDGCLSGVRAAMRLGALW